MVPAQCLPYRIEDYGDGDPIPSGYVRRDRIRHRLAIAGGSVLGGAHVLTVFLGAASLAESGDDRAAEKNAPMFVPAVGPFIAAATLDPPSVFVSVLVFDGLVQTAGLAMLIAGFAAEESYLVRATELELDVAPIVSGKAQGVGLRGRF